MGFHAKTIDKLVTRLFNTGKYNYIGKNVQYEFSEMDTVANGHIGKRKYMLVFEVKSKDEDKYWHKAVKQLFTHEKTFGDTVDKVYKFYVCPKSKDKEAYDISWIR